MRASRAKKIAAWCLIFLCAGLLLIFGILLARKEQGYAMTEEPVREKQSSSEPEPEAASLDTRHIETPDPVKAIYMSSWVAGTPSMRTKLLELIDSTELNAIVIDIKDATGKIAFETDDPLIISLGSSERRIRDLVPFIEHLHSKGMYVIGRISVFQDPYLAEKKPEWAIKSSGTGKVWKDKKGLSFLDPTSRFVHEYIEHIAVASYDLGFDEINFDYIRFPSDGAISDIAYPDDGRTRADIIRDFWKTLRENLRATRPHIVMSADLFGLTTSQADDMGIGQIIENAFPYFDFIAPMIYPSHYPPGWNSFKNPADHPYEVVHKAMADGIQRAEAAGYTKALFRPWIQDFNLGAVYTKDMIQSQIRALNELGITSYMVWDPKNTYTPAAYQKDTHQIGSVLY